MTKALVLAEKPSVGREIARVLGCKKPNGIISKAIIISLLGHSVISLN
ncbi:DNA topoisomerase III [Sporolactobacillus inulinus]|uniref:DNA topoisomerase III n=1 Tax=Sporolactobacillus inulinus TaxID=2078 RepID=A0A4Y1ZEQ7_9BACL|nr:DNA topoisomerase III [Sporolactobacillus inulinus]